MKSKKILVALVALFVGISSSFAFDGKTFWKEYGGGLKNGDSLVHAGVGFGGGLIANASYEKFVHINNMLPFSFGGMAAARIGPFFEVDAAATARYHFNLGIDKLDVYLGFLAGVGLYFGDAAGDTDLSIAPGFLWGTNVGATWFFTDKIAASVDCGYPYWVNAKFTMKF